MAWTALSWFLLCFSPLLVSSFQGGLTCGGYTCANHSQVYCAVDGGCDCREGFMGNGRIWCASDTKYICTMMGDPHITTFNQESAFIFLPCTQILSSLTMTAVDGAPAFNLTVTAITHIMHEARYASQVMVIALYIEIKNDNTQFEMRCDTNGCKNRTAPYGDIGNYTDQGLSVSTFPDVINGQTVVQVSGGIEVRFRAEDGSVAIVIPQDAVVDENNPGLCNVPTYNNTYNKDMSASWQLTYDDYMLYLNTKYIHREFEKDLQCLRRHENVCNTTETERSATSICGGLLIDPRIRRCFYDYRDSNVTMVMYDYNECHDKACDLNYDTYCNTVRTECENAALPLGC